MMFPLKMTAGCALACLLLAACSRETSPERTAVEKLRPAQLAAFLDNENLFFLDVRDPQEIVELGTLPGYVNIPIDQLERRLAEIPRDKTIITA